jgi:sugar (pentulose or hexulose) kinase
MMPGMFQGIDLGASEVKALLMDEDRQPAASASAPLEVSRPHPRRSEQSPEPVWTATPAAVDRLGETKATGLAAVRGFRLSGLTRGQMPCLIEGSAPSVVNDRFRPDPARAVHAPGS